MKKSFTLIKGLLSLLLLSAAMNAMAGIQDEKWNHVATGEPEEWYGSQEAVDVAENVLLYQKNNGGWMKNLEMHKPLTDSEKAAVVAAKSEHSCFDNYATTTEMRFLAKVYKHVKDERYHTAFIKGLDCIIAAQYSTGGWPQYWPLRGGYSDYITFNDDLMVNMLKVLRDVYSDSGDYEAIVDAATVTKAKAAYDKGLQCVLDCQIDDNGTKSVWCAQHDGTSLDPAEGRPHELPSYSACESATVLSFLMSIENPSQEVKDAVVAGIAWLDAHKIAGKKVVDVKDNSGVTVDRQIVDDAKSNLWGRFIQLNGSLADRVYSKLFNSTIAGNKSRAYVAADGKTYYYKDADNAKTTYNKDNAYQNIYSIYDDSRPYLRYRFLYTYEDAAKVKDANGVDILTSLEADTRKSYQYVGSWPQTIIEGTYPAWYKKNIQNVGKENYDINKDTYTSSVVSSEWSFNNGIVVSNTKGKGYSNGTGNTVKYSSGVDFTINLPEGKQVTSIEIYGYCNYAAEDSYISKLNGVTYGATDYVFPQKDADGVATYVTHKINFAAPVTGSLTFALSGKQCALAISLYNDPTASIGNVVNRVPKNGNIYNVNGTIVKKNASPVDVNDLSNGVYIMNGKKIIK